MRLDEIIRLELLIEEQETRVAELKDDLKAAKKELKGRIAQLRIAISEARTGQQKLEFEGGSHEKS